MHDESLGGMGAVTGVGHGLAVLRDAAPRRRLLIDEIRRLLERLHGVAWLQASLLYGAGLRLMECARLRVDDAA